MPQCCGRVDKGVVGCDAVMLCQWPTAELDDSQEPGRRSCTYGPDGRAPLQISFRRWLYTTSLNRCRRGYSQRTTQRRMVKSCMRLVHMYVIKLDDDNTFSTEKLQTLKIFLQLFIGGTGIVRLSPSMATLNISNTNSPNAMLFSNVISRALKWKTWMRSSPSVLEFERSRLQLSPKCSGAGWLRARN